MDEVYFDTIFLTPTHVNVWPHSFVILSAYATTGEVWPDEVNREADARLERELRSLCPRVLRITGASPDGLHQEPSWVAELPIDTALEIALRYKQKALFAVQNDMLVVIAVNPESPMVLGSFRSRLRAQP
jgi:hypothetical protein